MVKHMPPATFTSAHVASIATLQEFRGQRDAMLATTPIAANPTLFERTQDRDDMLYARTVEHRGLVRDQRDSVNLDNLVYDEIDNRRELRRRVRARKREFLASAMSDRLLG